MNPDEAQLSELAQLRAQVAEQGQQIKRLCAQLKAQQERLGALAGQADHDAPTAAPMPGEESPRWSRRALLLGGVGAAAGVAASVTGVATAPQARAVVGPMNYGTNNNATTDRTTLTSTHTTATLQVVNTGNGGGGTANHAILAQSVNPQGAAVYAIGLGATGLRAYSSGARGLVSGALYSYGEQNAGVVAISGSGPALRLGNVLLDAVPTTQSWAVGDFVSLSNGELWFCVQAGTPGKWRLLASPASAGAFVPVTPTRVYDSRRVQPSGGVPLAAGSSRDIYVADGRNLNTGAITVPNLVPTGTKAVALNLTVANGTGPGTVALAPGGSLTYSASAINFEAGQRIANGLITAINPSTRAIRAFAISASVAVILDITGYFRAT
jgi:uncharacterized coiled-coil protein SlyX